MFTKLFSIDKLKKASLLQGFLSHFCVVSFTMRYKTLKLTQKKSQSHMLIHPAYNDVFMCNS